MTTQREDLARDLSAAYGSHDGLVTPADVRAADGLIVAGWTKPRIVTEHYGDDGVEGLSHGAVILSGVTTSTAQTDGTWLDSWGSTYDFYELNVPATVLYEPRP